MRRPLPDDIYWPTAKGEELGRNLSDKVDAYLSTPYISARSTLIRRAFMYFYSIDQDTGLHIGSTVLRGGEQGELAKIRVNHARALVKTLLNLVTTQRFTWDPKAINSDSESMKEVRKAEQLLEFYFHELGIEKKAVQVAEQALGPGAGECFAHVTWDPFAGDEFLPDDQGKVTMSGDVSVAVVPTWDVIRDVTVSSWEASDWVIVRRWHNKWNVAEQYAPLDPLAQAPILGERKKTLRDAILAQPRTKDFMSSAAQTYEDSDQLEVFYFYHRRTAALPRGEEVIFLADGTLLTQPRPLTFSRWPLVRMSAGEFVGSPFPYSAYLEVLGIQELMDSLNTSVASNQSAFGTQFVAIAKNSDISPEDFSSGLRTIEVDDMSQAPQPLQLTKSPPETFTYLESLQSQQELLFGLTSIVRGQAAGADQSGSSQVFLKSQALENASDVQLSWINFLTDLGDIIFQMLNRFLSAPRQIAIVGQANRSLIEPFEMESGAFKRIKRIQVQLADLMMQSPQARYDFAMQAIQMGMIKTPDQAQAVLDTGRLEPLTRSVSDELILIEDENENLQNGNVPPVIAADDHMLHVREHRTLLASTLARNDPALVQRVFAHIDQHIQQWTTTNPLLLLMTGQQPPPMMGPPPPGAEGAPPGAEGAPPEGPPPPAPKQPPGNPTAGGPPALPSMPVDPATGQEYIPPGG